jgi:hypothetical protein
MKLWALAGSSYITLSFYFVSTFAFQTGYAQQIIRVPGDAATVQSGINMANDGDTVSIAPGTYGGPFDFKGKAITDSRLFMVSAAGDSNLDFQSVKVALYARLSAPRGKP